MLQSDELAALGLNGPEVRDLLERTQPISGSVISGTQSAQLLLCDFGLPLFQRFGLVMVNGTLNLSLEAPFALPRPVCLEGTGWFRHKEGFFCPVVLNDEALGFVFRFKLRDDTPRLEVFGHTRFRDRLGLETGDVLTMKVLPGETN